ncbi:MAG TPA: VOC family protein [Candidatus Limnocylindria bacterium]|nr:VOC family protein [Candidatus Limnocylindria bacterium]
MTATGRVVAVGHVGLRARDLDRLAAFYRETIGLHQSVLHPGVVAIFEVGDTDVFLLPGEPAVAEFDLAADDVDALHRRLSAAGVGCDAPQDQKQSGHRGFSFTDPEGNQVRVVNAHARSGR